MTMNELASSLFLEKSSASRLVDGLQRKGYVTRWSHPEDARALQVELTSRGRRLFEKIDADLLEERRRILQDLDPSHRKAVIRSLARLAEAAAERVEVRGGVRVRT
jgi:DNA-binding MarR family transcriptional regulator